MNYVNCPRCQAPIDPGFRFCKNCGVDLAYPYPPPHAGYYAQQPPATEETKAINSLLLLVGIKYGVTLLFFLMSLLSLWRFWSMMSNALSLLFAIALVVFAILIKHNRTRLYLWIFFGVEILLLLYNIFGGEYSLF